jgi:hypothetical protein
MNLIKNILLTLIICSAGAVFAGENDGGDDAGNGGFAYKQSIKLLEMASAALEEKIEESTLVDLVNYPQRREILRITLSYNNLEQLLDVERSRGGRPLAMDYSRNPPKVTLLKNYYLTFAGVLDMQLEDYSLEVQKRLLHEASHIWGYNEVQSEKFAKEFLENAEGIDVRPTGQVSIRNNFCSCLNGKSDIISSCDNFCAQKPFTNTPVLYVNTILGPDIMANPKLGSLYNWCNAQLSSDETIPQCTLTATDGTNTIESIPVSISKNSNSFTANIAGLSLDKTYILKLVESKSSNAESLEFQLTRKNQVPDTDLGIIRAQSVSQYSCFFYFFSNEGGINTISYYRDFYYFTSTPSPMPPMGYPQKILCHNSQVFPGNDNVQYPRLELIPNAFNLWDRFDPRFISSRGKYKVERLLQERLKNEYNISADISIFRLIGYPERPNDGNEPMGHMMLPFVNSTTGKSFCPKSSDYLGNDPLMLLLGDYVGDTEGLYLAEKEPEAINIEGVKRLVYGTSFVRERTLNSYGFYIDNGIKIKADENSMHSKTIYYYWPTSPALDPLIANGRKLYAVRSADKINGTIPTGILTSVATSDKRIGCIPLSLNK